MSGSRMLEDYVPDHDATVVSRILDAGGRITGKAVCEEWCFTATSCTAATGPVVNPYDETRMALGSSSGSAALVSSSLAFNHCKYATVRAYTLYQLPFLFLLALFNLFTCIVVQLYSPIKGLKCK